MLNIKKITTLIFVMMLASSSVFAVNIGRNVYGVLTETYSGVSIDNSSAGADYAKVYGSAGEKTDRVEGTKSNSVGAQYWFGVTFYSAQNMSAYSGGRLYFSAKVPTSVDVNDTGNVFKVSDGEDKVVYFNSTSIVNVADNSKGIKADNTWHTYYIPLSAFTGLNFSNITYLFIVGSPINNNTLLIDNVYWTKSSSGGSFSATIKNVSNNNTASSVTWAASSFRNGWQAAQQYIELDFDRISTNWSVIVLADNGNKTRNGLYCVDGNGTERVLQMAWRVSGDTLPNSSGDTLQIAESGAPRYGLYDSGKNPEDPWWYPWIYIKEKRETDIDSAYVTVWNLSGIHTYAGTNDAWDSLANFYERKPKLYFAANCADAVGGLSYTGKIAICLCYE